MIMGGRHPSCFVEIVKFAFPGLNRDSFNEADSCVR